MDLIKGIEPQRRHDAVWRDVPQNKRFLSAIDFTVSVIRKRHGSDLVGILLCGSVARCTPGRRSDVDLLIVTKRQNGLYQQQHKMVEQIRIDIVEINLSDAYAHLESKDDSGLITKLNEAILLYDATGEAGELVGRGRAAHAEGMRPLAAAEAQVILNALCELATSMENVEAGDRSTLNHALGLASIIIIELLTKMRRAWVTNKPIHQLANLRVYAPDFYSPLQALTSPDSPMPLRMMILGQVIGQIEEELRPLLGERLRRPKNDMTPSR